MTTDGRGDVYGHMGTFNCLVVQVYGQEGTVDGAEVSSGTEVGVSTDVADHEEKS